MRRFYEEHVSDARHIWVVILFAPGRQLTSRRTRNRTADECLTPSHDDGIVVEEVSMSERQTVHSYLSGSEQLRRTELVWGVVREPPAPKYGHQSVVTRTVVLLDEHVREQASGRVCVAPVDVVLDAGKALVVQPDVVFVSNARLEIVRDQIWGAPDLVAEVLSNATRRRDRTLKWRWYRQYGVREYWLIDPVEKSVTVASFESQRPARRRIFRNNRSVKSAVLAAFDRPASAFFE
jgi:Uma2 family endonuclease